jgi:hypothetical protein
MRVSLGLVMVAVLIAVCPGAPRTFAAGPGQPDVEVLLQHLDDLYRSKSSIARIQIDVTSTRSTRSMRLRAWTRGEEEVLVLIEAGGLASTYLSRMSDSRSRSDTSTARDVSRARCTSTM